MKKYLIVLMMALIFAMPFKTAHAYSFETIDNESMITPIGTHDMRWKLWDINGSINSEEKILHLVINSFLIEGNQQNYFSLNHSIEDMYIVVVERVEPYQVNSYKFIHNALNLEGENDGLGMTLDIPNLMDFIGRDYQDHDIYLDIRKPSGVNEYGSTDDLWYNVQEKYMDDGISINLGASLEYIQGYHTGFEDGQNTNPTEIVEIETYGGMGWILTLLGAFTMIFAIELLPNITIGMLVGVPLLFSLIFFILKIVRG